MKKILLIISIIAVVSFGDTTAISIFPLKSDTVETVLDIKEPKKDNMTIQAVIIMLFVGLAMGFSGELNPK